jgi:tetratricopeptide (TPR) repeat protein
MHAYLAWRENRSADAERWYRTLLRAYPADAEAWYQFADFLFHDNSRRGRSFAESREPFRRALALQPADREALSHLIRVAARSGDALEVDTLTAAAMKLATESERTALRTFRAFTVGDSTARRQALLDLAQVDGSVLSVLAWRLSVFAADLAGAEQILRLATDPARPVPLQLEARNSLQYVLLGRGRLKEAKALSQWLINAGDPDANGAMQARLPMLLLSDAVRDPVLTKQSLVRIDSLYRRDMAAGTRPDSGTAYELLCIAAMLRADAGQINEANNAAVTLARARLRTAADARAAHCAATVRAMVALRSGQPGQAIDVLLADRSRSAPDALSEPLGRFMLAETLYATGRHAEAADWYRSICERGYDEVPFLAPAERRLAELAFIAGDKERGASHYRRFVRLWSDADAELQPQVEDARRRLALLEQRSR